MNKKRETTSGDATPLLPKIQPNPTTQRYEGGEDWVSVFLLNLGTGSTTLYLSSCRIDMQEGGGIYHPDIFPTGVRIFRIPVFNMVLAKTEFHFVLTLMAFALDGVNNVGQNRT